MLKKFSKVLATLLASSYASISLAQNGPFALPAATGLVAGSKFADLLTSSGWVVNVAAGLMAIVCFIFGGNSITRGDYAKGAGGIIGGCVVAIGAFMVTHVMQ